MLGRSLKILSAFTLLTLGAVAVAAADEPRAFDLVDHLPG